MTREFQNIRSSQTKFANSEPERDKSKKNWEAFKYALDFLESNQTSFELDSVPKPNLEDHFYQNYWLRGHCDKLPPAVAFIHFDTMNLMGPKEAFKILQCYCEMKETGEWEEGIVKYIDSKNEAASAVFLFSETTRRFSGSIGAKALESMMPNGGLAFSLRNRNLKESLKKFYDPEMVGFRFVKIRTIEEARATQ